MGVYFFACGDAYFKVGHHRVTVARPNVYYRVARRGFQSCLHPACLDHKLAMDDVRLIAWFPLLGGRDEGALHRMDPSRIGEFHRVERLPALLAEARRRGAEAGVTEAEKEQARLGVSEELSFKFTENSFPLYCPNYILAPTRGATCRTTRLRFSLHFRVCIGS